MGAAVGLLLGLGLLAVWSAFLPQPPRPDRPARDLLGRAGLGQVGRLEALVAAGGLCVAVALAVQVALGLPGVSFAAGVVTAGICHGWLVHRGSRRLRAIGEAWPDVLDLVASSLRAGLSPAEALVRLERRAPPPLDASMGRLARDVRASGRPREALLLWSERETDPVTRRAAAVLLVTAERGDAAGLLRAVAGDLREDARLRSAVEVRRRVVANLARAMLLAPVAAIAVFAVRGDGWAEFSTRSGAVLLVACVVVATVGHRVTGAWQSAPLERWGLA